MGSSIGIIIGQNMRKDVKSSANPAGIEQIITTKVRSRIPNPLASPTADRQATHVLVFSIRRCTSQFFFSKCTSVVRHHINSLTLRFFSCFRLFPDAAMIVPQTALTLTLTLHPSPIPYTELSCLRHFAFRPLRGRSARFAGGHDFPVLSLVLLSLTDGRKGRLTRSTADFEKKN